MKIGSVHFYVTNADDTSNWFVDNLNFQVVDYYRDDSSQTIAVKNQLILLVFSSPLKNQGVVANYLNCHAEGIVDITFLVKELELIMNYLQQHNYFEHKVLQPIQQVAKIKNTWILGWNDLHHTLIESQNWVNGYRLPNGKLRTFDDNSQLSETKLNFVEIDHIVLNVERGKLKEAVTYYQSLFKWQIQQTFKIKTKRSGLFSQALIDRTGTVQFNINEPSTANSQIQEFLDLNRGSGIQHLAIKSNNLIKDVAIMRSRNVSFLPIPATYYLQLKPRLKQALINFSTQELQSISEQKILIDWQQHQSNSLLMQIFTQPILEKPTFFLEFIERRQQAMGFGEGNFQALFAAVEQHQIANYA